MPRKDRDGLYKQPGSSNWYGSYTDADGCRRRCSTGTDNQTEARAILSSSTLSEHLSLFVELLFTIGGIGSGLTFSVTDFHLAEDLRQRRIPPG